MLTALSRFDCPQHGTMVARHLTTAAVWQGIPSSSHLQQALRSYLTYAAY